MTLMTNTLRQPGERTRRFLWPVLAALLVISWSSGFVGIRYASEHAGVLLVLFWRPLLSGLILAPFALAIGPRLRVRDVLIQMGLGVMIVFVYLGGFALAIEQRVPTGLVALISDLVPLAIAGLSHVVLGERMTGRQWLGTAIAILGVVLVSFHSLSIGTAPVWAYVVTVGAMLVFALATVLQKSLGMVRMPIHQSLSIQFLSGAVLFGLCAGYQGSLAPPLEKGFMFGILWLVLIATFLCYTIYYACLRLYPASKVSAAVYLSPPVTMVWGWALFSEPLSLSMLVGLGVTLVGVWMTAFDGH